MMRFGIGAAVLVFVVGVRLGEGGEVVVSPQGDYWSPPVAEDYDPDAFEYHPQPFWPDSDFIEARAYLPRANFVVTVVQHYDRRTEKGRTEGLIATQIGTGRRRFLRAPEPKGLYKYRFVNYGRDISLSDEEVGVVVECSLAGVDETKMPPRYVLWKWNPFTKQVKPVGQWNEEVSLSLLRSLSGTDFDVTWFDRETGASNGWALVYCRQHPEQAVLLYASNSCWWWASYDEWKAAMLARWATKHDASNANRVEEEPEKPVNSDEKETARPKELVRFFVGFAPGQIIRLTEREEGKDLSDYKWHQTLDCIDLGQNGKSVWKLDTEQFAGAGEDKKTIMVSLPVGLSRPVRVVPLILTDSKKLVVEIISVSALSGEILAHTPFLDGISLLNSHVYVSPNGRYVFTSEYGVRQNPQMTILDLAGQKRYVFASYRPKVEDTYPAVAIGITNEGMALIKSDYGLFGLKGPYNGEPEMLFSLKIRN